MTVCAWSLAMTENLCEGCQRYTFEIKIGHVEWLPFDLQVLYIYILKILFEKMF